MLPRQVPIKVGVFIRWRHWARQRHVLNHQRGYPLSYRTFTCVVAYDVLSYAVLCEIFPSLSDLSARCVYLSAFYICCLLSCFYCKQPILLLYTWRGFEILQVSFSQKCVLRHRVYGKHSTESKSFPLWAYLQSSSQEFLRVEKV